MENYVFFINTLISQMAKLAAFYEQAPPQESQLKSIIIELYYIML